VTDPHKTRQGDPQNQFRATATGAMAKILVEGQVHLSAHHRTFESPLSQSIHHGAAIPLVVANLIERNTGIGDDKTPPSMFSQGQLRASTPEAMGKIVI
jgi:hypothetical protein